MYSYPYSNFPVHERKMLIATRATMEQPDIRYVHRICWELSWWDRRWKEKNRFYHFHFHPSPPPSSSMPSNKLCHIQAEIWRNIYYIFRFYALALIVCYTFFIIEYTITHCISFFHISLSLTHSLSLSLSITHMYWNVLYPFENVADDYIRGLILCDGKVCNLKSN